MNTIKNWFRRIRVDIILRAIFYVVMAIFFFISPLEAMGTTAVVLSTFVLIDGVFSLCLYFFTFGASGLIGTTLLGSIFKIIYGILFLSYPGLGVNVFCVMFAVYIIVSSCNGIEESLKLRRMGADWKVYVLPLILSIVCLIGGIIMLFLAPADLVSVSGYIAGAILIVAAIMDILLVADMYKVKHNVKKAVDSVKDNIEKIDEDNVIDA